jgi:hypothetical protein
MSKTQGGKQQRRGCFTHRQPVQTPIASCELLDGTILNKESYAIISDVRGVNGISVRALQQGGTVRALVSGKYKTGRRSEWFTPGEVVMIEQSEKNCIIIYRYSREEVRELIERREISKDFVEGINQESKEEKKEIEIPFNFEDI